jgi:hypothetical protein
MALGKRQKNRIKMMSASEAKKTKSAVKTLHSELLIGDKRAMEITRFIERNHRC